MSVSTVESRRRRQSPSQQSNHSPKLSRSRKSTAIDMCDLATQRISQKRCSSTTPSPSPSTSESIPTYKGQGQTYTVITSGHFSLFSKISNFPSRTLPPLGSRASNLDQDDANVFKVGQDVYVRRFLGVQQGWTEWQIGKVSERCLIRGFVGTNARGYAVKTLCPESGKYNPPGRYARFLGEICDINGPVPSVCAIECARRREQANYIYTQIPSPILFQGRPLSSIWTPARVLKWGEDQRIFVRSLVGPTAGEDFEVYEALSYTEETSKACRARGSYVMRPDGSIEAPTFVDTAG